MQLFDASRTLFEQSSRGYPLDSYVIVFTSAVTPTMGGIGSRWLSVLSLSVRTSATLPVLPFGPTSRKSLSDNRQNRHGYVGFLAPSGGRQAFSYQGAGEVAG